MPDVKLAQEHEIGSVVRLDEPVVVTVRNAREQVHGGAMVVAPDVAHARAPIGEEPHGKLAARGVECAVRFAEVRKVQRCGKETLSVGDIEGWCDAAAEPVPVGNSWPYCNVMAGQRGNHAVRVVGLAFGSLRLGSLQENDKPKSRSNDSRSECHRT